MKIHKKSLSSSFKKPLLNSFIGMALIIGASITFVGCNGSDAVNTQNQIDTDTQVSIDAESSLDANEQTHLMFMREEEKLARDVYIKLGIMYPNSRVFGIIDDSEQTHTTAVKNMIEKYGLKDPNTNDNVGAYTGEDYGSYFTKKYINLIDRANISELEALYVGAYIEELDMLDINQCPEVIVEADNGINDVSECGKIYTANEDIIQLYDSLLDGSNNHLESYVKNIEKQMGAGSYEAQVLSQDQLNEILGR